MMRTANPALNKKTFARYETYSDEDNVMTVGGTVNKTAFMLCLTVASASFLWKKFFAMGEIEGIQAAFGAVGPWMVGGAIGALICALIIIFKHTMAPILTPVYAILKGLMLGGFSAVLEAQFPGIVIQAVSLTLGTLFALLIAYKSGVIKVTENFKLGVCAATGAIFLIYLVSFILSMFGMPAMFLHDSGIISIGFSLVVVVIAALNLVLDFDFIEDAAERGAPKYMEWYAAFGLLVTLFWLYIEILRLLSKLRDR